LYLQLTITADEEVRCPTFSGIPPAFEKGNGMDAVFLQE
jgi:hypothetical protein